MPLTPGQYLRKRREAAGLARDALATFLDTDPPVSTRTRAEWIESIEADAYPVPPSYVPSIEQAVSLDVAVLDALVIAHAGIAGVDLPQVCARCGCSRHDPCWPGGWSDVCGWAADDLCTSCAARDTAELVAAARSTLPMSAAA